MVAFLTYCQIFASAVLALILLIFPGIISYKIWVGIIGVISILYFFKEIILYKYKIKPILNILIFGILILLLYSITIFFYDTISDDNYYYSYLLVILGQVLPITLCASIVAQREKIQYKIKNLAPIVAIIFTFVSLIAAFFSKNTTSGGFIDSENGLNYQANSYLAAYATGFAIQYILSFNTIHYKSIFRYNILRYIVLCCIGVNLITILISGGRGGLVLFIAQCFMAIYILRLTNRIKAKDLMKVICYGIIVIFIITYCIEFSRSADIKTNGFNRIINAIQKGDSSGRDIIYILALDIIKDSIIYGHGVGSVFFKLGFYSHNCILDVLIELGIIGTMGYVLVIIMTFNKLKKIIKQDISNSIYMVIFLDGFIMSLFSGYYITHIPICWIVAFIYNINKNQQNNVSSLCNL